MEGIVRTVSESPLVSVVVSIAVLLIVYFLFKSLIKLALILILVAVVIGGYNYFQHPESRPANLKEALQKARTGAGKMVEQGKEAYEMGKEMLDKGRAVLDTGIDKGKEAAEKGADTAEKIGKVIKGDKKEERRGPRTMVN